MTPLLLRQKVNFPMFLYEEIGVGFIYSICCKLVSENFSMREMFQVNTDSPFPYRASARTPSHILYSK